MGITAILAFSGEKLPDREWMEICSSSVKYGAPAIAVIDAAYGAVSQRLLPIVYNACGLIDSWTALARNLDKERTGYDENYIGPRTSSE